MCDFKPGDEVVCVDDAGLNSDGPRLGGVYVAGPIQRSRRGGLFVRVCGYPDGGLGYYARRFRKVQRRDLTAWLATANTIEEPKRTPAKAPA